MRNGARWAAVLVGLVAWGASAEVKVPPPHDIALTISGGVSLGAYEAGLTWGTVRFLRLARAQPIQGPTFRPEPGGRHWGQRWQHQRPARRRALVRGSWTPRADDSVDSNLLRDTWLPVGLDELLPENASALPRRMMGSSPGARWRACVAAAHPGLHPQRHAPLPARVQRAPGLQRDAGEARGEPHRGPAGDDPALCRAAGARGLAQRPGAPAPPAAAERWRAGAQRAGPGRELRIPSLPGTVSTRIR